MHRFGTSGARGTELGMHVAAKAALGAGSVAAAAIGVDQASKAYVRANHHAGTVHNHLGQATDQLPIVHDFEGTDEVSILYIENDGMFGGGFKEGSKLVSAVALPLIPLTAGAVLYSGHSMGGGTAMRAASIAGAGLLAGGGLSNGVEKQVRGKATDMLFVSRTNTVWNGADVALGAGFLLSAAVVGTRVVRGFRA